MKCGLGGTGRAAPERKKPPGPPPAQKKQAGRGQSHPPTRQITGGSRPKPPGRPQETRRGGGAGRAGGGHGGWGIVWVYLDASALPNVLPTAAAIAAAATLATAAAAAAAVAAAATAMSAKHRKAQVTKLPTARPCLALESPVLLMHRLAYCIPDRYGVSINRSRCPVSFESDPCISGNCPGDVCGGKPRRHSYS